MKALLLLLLHQLRTVVVLLVPLNKARDFGKTQHIELLVRFCLYR